MDTDTRNQELGTRNQKPETERVVYAVPFVEPGKLYAMLKAELDAAYFEVMARGDLIMRAQLSEFEQNLATFVGSKYAV